MTDLDDCRECFGYATANWWALRGACASVGIEHGMSTDEMMRFYMERHHARHEADS